MIENMYAYAHTAILEGTALPSLAGGHHMLCP